MTHSTTSAAFFESKYQQDADPWNFEADTYEQERYAIILHALDGRFTRAFEPGCSIGVLTQSLAHICARLEAIDISSTAVRRAKERCNSLPNVHIQCGRLPEAIPSGFFDLIVLSEIGYYFEPIHLREIIHRLSESLSPGGILLASHWLGESADHLLSGDQVHQVILDCDLLIPELSKRYTHFRLDRMTRK